MSDSNSKDNQSETELEPDHGPVGDRARTASAPSFYEVPDDAQETRNDPDLLKHSKIELPFQLDEFELVSQLGEGGVGVVFQANSRAYQQPVAVKLLRPEVRFSESAVQRFVKESRIHSEIRCDNVVRHLEFRQGDAFTYIVSELVDGISLAELIAQTDSMDVELAIHIIRDVLKGLSAIHEAETIHRDVKPGNVLVVFDREDDQLDFERYRHSKLTDFGLARHLNETDSLAMTNQRAILGTPLYMAPEQHALSRDVDARADIYSVGATLYHMISGSPPFDSNDPAKLDEMRRHQRQRSLGEFIPEVSEGLSLLVDKALEKNPEMRYANATEMLDDLERAIRGEPLPITESIGLPERTKSSREFHFEWNLPVTVEQLWPLVTDTDRVNRALGLPAPTFQPLDEEGPGTFLATARFLGMPVRWKEHPFQWVRNREFSVLREFDRGPFAWVASIVELKRLDRKQTCLVHRFVVEPRGLLGRMLTPIQFRFSTGPALEKIYHRLAELIVSQEPEFCDLPFAKPAKLGSSRSRLLESRLMQLSEKMKAGQLPLVEALGNYLETSSDFAVSRIRPKRLAIQLDSSLEFILKLCLHAVEVGLLKIGWSVICPVCRQTSQTEPLLEQIKNHSHCRVCNVDFETDFSTSVELIFVVHDDIRKADSRLYCIGGPFHAPHVIFQDQVPALESRKSGIELSGGHYRLNGPQLTRQTPLVASAQASKSSAKVSIPDPNHDRQLSIRPGHVAIELVNQTRSPVLVRLETVLERALAISAVEACRLPGFRDLFPDQILKPEQLVEKRVGYVLLVKLVDVESFLRDRKESDLIEFWQELQAAISNSNQRSTCQFDHALFVFETGEELQRRWMDLLDWLEESIGLSAFTFVVHRGQVFIGHQPDQANHYGATIRDCFSILDHLNPALEPEGLLLVLDNDLNESLAPTLRAQAKPLELSDVMNGEKSPAMVYRLNRDHVNESSDVQDQP